VSFLLNFSDYSRTTDQLKQKFVYSLQKMRRGIWKLEETLRWIKYDTTVLLSAGLDLEAEQYVPINIFIS